jgi:PAS domain S-box-containing protein
MNQDQHNEREALGPSIPLSPQTRQEELNEELNEQLNEQLNQERQARSQLQEELQKAEERLKVIVEGVKDYAIFMLDPQGRVATWNQGAERTKQYKREEILGKHFSVFYPPEDLANDKPGMEMREVARTGRFEDEGWRLKKDGSRFWANVIITAFYDENGVLRGYSKVTRDITERKRAEDKLRSANEELEARVEDRTRDLEKSKAELQETLNAFQGLFQQAAVGIAQVDLEGRYIRVNQKICDMLGYSEEELLHQPVFKFVHPDHIAEAQARYAELFRGETHAFTVEKRYICKDGTIIWGKRATAAVTGPDGKIRYAVSVLEDITEKRRSSEELERLVEQRTHELVAANKELESFSYSVSHDLRAPLRGIDGFSQALLEDYGNMLDDTGKRYLRYIREGSQQMGRVIDDILNLSRISRAEVAREKVNLTERAQAILQELRGQEPERQVEVVIAEDMIAKADSGLVNILLDNLLGNAWKFSAKMPVARIEVGKQLQGEETVYFVKDNGAGFDMAYVHKLFGAFQRLHTVHEFQGTGIGLATTKRIIQKHKGRIWADSKPGEGAVFYFTLGKGITV